jgi:hypothetical protein
MRLHKRLKLKVFNQSKVMNPASFFLSFLMLFWFFVFSGIVVFRCLSIFSFLLGFPWDLAVCQSYVLCFFETNGNNLFFLLFVAFLFYFVKGRLGY